MMEKFGTIYENVKQKDYTTYKLSGTIKKVIYPNNVKDLTKLLSYLKQNNIKHKVIGNGSNLIFKDNYDGVIIKLDRLNKVLINGNVIEVDAGYSLSKLALKTAKLGLSGLEFASGIPGTIGGAIYMNAGAYKKCMRDIVESVTVLNENGELVTLKNKDLKFEYRQSILKNSNLICLKATLKLAYGNKEEILKKIKDHQYKRLSSQPLEYPSAGSVFRNPEAMFAGKLIEDLNLKGTQIGDAAISEKHANFIINKGNATGKDVIELINLIKDKVKKEYNIELICEQEIIE